MTNMNQECKHCVLSTIENIEKFECLKGVQVLKDHTTTWREGKLVSICGATLPTMALVATRVNLGIGTAEEERDVLCTAGDNPEGQRSCRF